MAEQHEDFQDWELLQNPEEDTFLFDSDDERSDYFSLVSLKDNHLNTEPVVVVKSLDDEQEMILGFKMVKNNSEELGFEEVSEMVGNDEFDNVNITEKKLMVRNECLGDLRSSGEGENDGLEKMGSLIDAKIGRGFSVVQKNSKELGFEEVSEIVGNEGFDGVNMTKNCEMKLEIGVGDGMDIDRFWVRFRNDSFGDLGYSGDGKIEGVVGENDGLVNIGPLTEAKREIGFEGVETNEEVGSEDHHSECESEFSRNSEGEGRCEGDDDRSVGGDEVGEQIRYDSKVVSECVVMDEQGLSDVVEEEKDVVEIGGRVNVDLRSRVEEEGKRGVVWWKVPLEIMKYCGLRVGPVWSFSIAAALMGLMILRKRMFRMKQKKKSIPLVITMDDKKVSQFMARAARLNDAFSVVKSGPVIRSVPVIGVTPWPIMGLR